MVLRATFGRIVRLFSWLFCAGLLLLVIAMAWLWYMLASTPSFHGSCGDSYECRPGIQGIEPLNVVQPAASETVAARPTTEREELRPWMWGGEEPATSDDVCHGVWVGGLDGAPLCQGTLEERRISGYYGDEIDPRATLHISTSDGERRCHAKLPARPGTQLRLERQGSDVIVFGRNETTLSTWRYSANCQQLDQREIPSADLFTQDRTPRSPPIVARQTVTGAGVHFETTGNCSTTCRMKIWERAKAPKKFAQRESEHVLFSPTGVTFGRSERYLWWAYHRETKWYVHVIDRVTHQPVFEKAGSVEPGVDTPIRGISIHGDHLAVEFERSPSRLGTVAGQQRQPRFETHVYDVTTNALEVQFVLDYQLQFRRLSNGELSPRWEERRRRR